MSGYKNQNHVSFGIYFILQSCEISFNIIFHGIASKRNISKFQLFDAKIFECICGFPSSWSVTTFSQSFKGRFDIYTLITTMINNREITEPIMKRFIVTLYSRSTLRCAFLGSKRLIFLRLS